MKLQTKLFDLDLASWEKPKDKKMSNKYLYKQLARFEAEPGAKQKGKWTHENAFHVKSKQEND